MDTEKNYTGNPVPEVQSSFDRSPGRTLAWGHPDLREQADLTGPTVRTGSDTITFIGETAFHNANSHTDTSTMNPQPDGGRPTVRLYDAASAAGRYYNMPETGHVGDATGHLSGQYSSAPIGQHNGTHDASSQTGACTTPRSAMKNSDLVEVIKTAMKQQGVL